MNKKEVENKIKQGKYVPLSILIKYPDLRRKYHKRISKMFKERLKKTYYHSPV